MAVKPVPDGYHTVTPYLVVDNASALVDFLTRAFGATEHHVMRGPDGSVWHGDLMIGDSHVMLGEAGGTNKPFTGMIYLYVPDADAMYRSALAAGGKSIQQPATQFYGDRHGAIEDCCGNQWWVATHVEDVPDDELRKRAAAAAQQRTATA
jgi:uncharacterized glyoxalase superfamily protein PhnB